MNCRMNWNGMKMLNIYLLVLLLCLVACTPEGGRPPLFVPVENEEDSGNESVMSVVFSRTGGEYQGMPETRNFEIIFPKEHLSIL